VASGSGGSPGGTVVVRFTLTPAQYAEGMRTIMIRQPTTWAGPALGVVLLVAGFGLGEVLPVAMALVFLTVGGVTYFLAPAMRFKGIARLSAPQVHTFSGTGISVRAGSQQGNLPWGFYQRAVERPGVYVLLRTAREGNFIPKEAFDSPGEEERFRVLVADHLPASWSG